MNGTVSSDGLLRTAARRILLEGEDLERDDVPPPQASPCETRARGSIQEAFKLVGSALIWQIIDTGIAPSGSLGWRRLPVPPNTVPSDRRERGFNDQVRLHVVGDKGSVAL
jgi:hypothetical protein